MNPSLKRLLFGGVTALLGDSDSRVTLPVLKGPARGLKFNLDLVGRMESAYFKGSYDRDILQALATLIQPGWVIWDCGTYLGFYTVFFSRAVRDTGRVVAIEPDPRNLQRTRQNAALNERHNIAFVHAAVGTPSGQIEFILSDNSNSHVPGVYVGGDRGTYSQIERQDGRILVDCVSLDQLLIDRGLPAPDLIKIDIEGAEEMALQHVDRLIGGARPLIVLELHNPDCDQAAWDFGQRSSYELLDLATGKKLQSRSEVHGTLLCRPPR
jgi:FkbM family methyltransferase